MLVYQRVVEIHITSYHHRFNYVPRNIYIQLNPLVSPQKLVSNDAAYSQQNHGQLI